MYSCILLGQNKQYSTCKIFHPFNGYKNTAASTWNSNLQPCMFPACIHQISKNPRKKIYFLKWELISIIVSWLTFNILIHSIFLAVCYQLCATVEYELFFPWLTNPWDCKIVHIAHFVWQQYLPSLITL